MDEAYETFLAVAQQRQANYIRGERRRMKKAEKAWLAYAAKMAALELHSLTGGEIMNRLRELEVMQARIPETHGDSPAMRDLFAIRQVDNSVKID